MKLAILGYGKMGKEVEMAAEERGHEIVYTTSSPLDSQKLKKADAAIDFSIPDAAFDNITTCFKEGVPVVSGTTGWLEKYDEAVNICHDNKGAFIYASNFSLGVNLFFQLNKHLSELMQKFQDEYRVSVEEIHHTEKLDKPSGTAKTLADQILDFSNKKNWFLQEDKETRKEGLPVKAIRQKDVYGTHRINYTSDIDQIEIKHTAFSRKGFSLGAVMAAEFLSGKQGVYKMEDVLGL